MEVDKVMSIDNDSVKKGSGKNSRKQTEGNENSDAHNWKKQMSDFGDDDDKIIEKKKSDNNKFRIKTNDAVRSDSINQSDDKKVIKTWEADKINDIN